MFLQANTEIYTGWYLSLYRIILNLTQNDIEEYTGWYLCLYNVILKFIILILKFIQTDSGVKRVTLKLH